MLAFCVCLSPLVATDGSQKGKGEEKEDGDKN